MILFLSDAAFLTHGVQMQMLNEITMCVYSQCSCHLVCSAPLLEKKKKIDLIGPDWIPW